MKLENKLVPIVLSDVNTKIVITIGFSLTLRALADGWVGSAGLGIAIPATSTSFWGRSKNKSGSESCYEPRIGSWAYNLELFRSSELIRPRAASECGSSWATGWGPQSVLE
ncbi:unnamed protein product [Prunus armeniaca]